MYTKNNLKVSSIFPFIALIICVHLAAVESILYQQNYLYTFPIQLSYCRGQKDPKVDVVEVCCIRSKQVTGGVHLAQICVRLTLSRSILYTTTDN